MCPMVIKNCEVGMRVDFWDTFQDIMEGVLAFILFVFKVIFSLLKDLGK